MANYDRHPAKYPIVDPDPDWKKQIRNFNISDVLSIGAFAASGYVFGWFGASKPLRTSNARITASIGLLAGTVYACQSSMQRLMGIYPNESEVSKYGVISSEALDRYKKVGTLPNIDFVDPKE